MAAPTTAPNAEFQDAGKPVAQPFYLVDVNGNPITSTNPSITTAVIQAVNGTALAADQSNTELRVSNYGKNSAAGDTPISVNASGQQQVQLVDSAGTNKASVDSTGNQSFRGGFTESSGLSAGSLNADLVASTDVSGYRFFALQLGGTWSGTLTVQASNDNSTFFSVNCFQAASGATSQATFTNNQFVYSPIYFRYLRVRMTSYSSGTATGVLELYTIAPGIQPINSININGGNTLNTPNSTTTGGTTDFHLISANTTNAANIKNSAGQVYGYEIYNTNAAARYVKLYNTSGTPTAGSGTPVRTIGVPPSGRAFFHSSTGIAFGSGIGVTTVTGIADSDNTAVGTNDLSIEIDYK